MSYSTFCQLQIKEKCFSILTRVPFEYHIIPYETEQNYKFEPALTGSSE